MNDDFVEGDWVIYRPHPAAAAEDGTVVRVGDPYVFVRFTGDANAKAVHHDLLSPGRRP